MQNTPNTRLAIKVLLALVVLAGKSKGLAAQTELHFRTVNDNLIVASLQSGQKEDFDFILDTGADTTIIDPSIAARLGFQAIDRIPQTTLSGVQKVTRGSIRSLSAGSAQTDHLVVLVEDLSALRRIDGKIRGIAGQNFLAHFNYLLDYRRHTVTFENGTEIDGAVAGQRVPIDARENRMLVTLMTGNQNSLTLMLDSGASQVVLLRAASKAIDPARQTTAVLTTSTGQAAVLKGSIRELRIGSERLRDVPATASLAQPAERIGDGMLPTSLFQALYVNNRESFVVFNPRESRPSSPSSRMPAPAEAQ
jgi:predicted aspartyl protease